MNEQLDRIEKTIEKIDAKLDNHLERIAKLETHVTWAKWLSGLVLSAIGTVAMAITKFKS